MKDKKILIAIPTLSNGGAERVASIWANGLAKKHNNIYLFSLYPVEEEYKLSGKVKRINLTERKSDYKNMSSLKRITSIRDILKRNKIDLVIPLVTYMGIIFNVASIGMDIKLIETIRNNPYLSPPSKGIRVMRDFSVRKSEGCIFQNKEQKEYFSKYKLNNQLVISNPVDGQFIETQRIYRSKPTNIVAIGRLHSQKNFEMLIDAATSVHEKYNITLNIYGDGEERDKLEKQVCANNASEYIVIHSRTNEVLKVLLESDIFVLSSNYEGMPNVLMEAMATGLPCISTDCPTGPSDLIKSNETGMLVQVGKKEQLVAALEFYIENYDKAIEMGKKARSSMMNYKEEIIIEQLEDYIYGVLKG